MPTPLTRRTGKAWADVKDMSGRVVHIVETRAFQIDRVVSGMLINMSPDYYVDYRYEFPEAGERGEDGKIKATGKTPT